MIKSKMGNIKVVIDGVWNPVWGCFNNCPYCYARKYAKRFWTVIWDKEVMYKIDKFGHYPHQGKWSEDEKKFLHYTLKHFNPVWLESNFVRKFPKKTKRIFVNSMSDIKYWSSHWMELVLNKIKEYPQHTFLFLTKFPEVYTQYKFPVNCYLGVSSEGGTSLEAMKKTQILRGEKVKRFISFEPLKEVYYWSLKNFDWVIIGKETGNRKGKIITERADVEVIVRECKRNKIPVFLKGSLKDIWGEKLIQEYPE